MPHNKIYSENDKTRKLPDHHNCLLVFKLNGHDTILCFALCPVGYIHCISKLRQIYQAPISERNSCSALTLITHGGAPSGVRQSAILRLSMTSPTFSIPFPVVYGTTLTAGFRGLSLLCKKRLIEIQTTIERNMMPLFHYATGLYLLWLLRRCPTQSIDTVAPYTEKFCVYSRLCW